jgi:putative transposase
MPRVVRGLADSLRKDEHLLTVLRYVEGNPLRAGLVSSAKEWLWSSHKERICKGKNSLVEDVPIKLPANWDRYIDEPLTEKDLERMRQSVARQSPYGQTEWQIKVAQELGLECTLRPRGRPKKGEEDEKK